MARTAKKQAREAENCEAAKRKSEFAQAERQQSSIKLNRLEAAVTDDIFERQSAKVQLSSVPDWEMSLVDTITTSIGIATTMPNSLDGLVHDFMLDHEKALLPFVRKAATAEKHPTLAAAEEACSKLWSKFLSANDVFLSACRGVRVVVNASTSDTASIDASVHCRNNARDLLLQAADNFINECPWALSEWETYGLVSGFSQEERERIEWIISQSIEPLDSCESGAGFSEKVQNNAQEEEFGKWVEDCRRAEQMHDSFIQQSTSELTSSWNSIRRVMGALAGDLQLCSLALEKAAFPEGGLPNVKAKHDGLFEQISAREALIEGLRERYKSVAERLRASSFEAVRALHGQTKTLLDLTSALKSARQLKLEGAAPDDAVLADIGKVQIELKKAEKEERNARFQREEELREVQDHPKVGREGLEAAGERLQEAKSHVRHMSSKLQVLWREVFRLSSSFPELPGRVCSALGDNSRLIPFVDPSSALLLEPSRSLDMYDEDMEPLSIAGKNSRHDVFKAWYEGSPVCLKKFVVESLLASDPGKSVRSMQREIDSLAKLEHPNVIKVQLFFLEEEPRTKNLCAYVEYPFCSEGSMEAWLVNARQREDSHSRIQVVLWDALKGLEHVHSHGVVHCDIKLANVLVDERGGRPHGILADFDLCKNQRERMGASVAAASISTIGGVRGTPGILTMAPEVLELGKEPDQSSDMYCFGGIMLQALFETLARVWSSRLDRWGCDGTPVFEATDTRDNVPNLIQRLLCKEKESRPSAASAISDSFFSAGQQATDLLSKMLRTRHELEVEFASLSSAKDKHLKDVVQAEKLLQSQEFALERNAKDEKCKLLQHRRELEAKEQSIQQAGAQAHEERQQIMREKKELELEQKRKKSELTAEKSRLKLERDALIKEKREEDKLLASRKESIEKKQKRLEEREREIAKSIHQSVPPYWRNRKGFYLEQSGFVSQALQDFFRASSCCTSTQNATVAQVLRIENENLWNIYQVQRATLARLLAGNQAVPCIKSKTKQPDQISSTLELCHDLNEFYLFHGTDEMTAITIAEHGFDERVANMGGLYGAGSYFADSACKSFQYCKDQGVVRTFLFCRVVMGWPFQTNVEHKNERRPPQNQQTPGRPFDAIFAESGVARRGQQVHNEYVVFRASQVYPEYLVKITV